MSSQNRKIKRAREAAARKQFAKPYTRFEEIDLTKAEKIPEGMTRAYRNTRYTIMIFEDQPTSAGPATRVFIQRLDNKPLPRHWSEIQRIKNELFGPETTAIEYYPPEHEVIDEHFIYWIWIFPAGVIPTPLFFQPAVKKTDPPRIPT